MGRLMWLLLWLLLGRLLMRLRARARFITVVVSTCSALFGAAFIGSGVAAASPGQVDIGFGRLGNGTVLSDTGRHEFPVKVLRQTDGKITHFAVILNGEEIKARRLEP